MTSPRTPFPQAQVEASFSITITTSQGSTTMTDMERAIHRNLEIQQPFPQTPFLHSGNASPTTGHLPTMNMAHPMFQMTYNAGYACAQTNLAESHNGDQDNDREEISLTKERHSALQVFQQLYAKIRNFCLWIA